MSTDTIIIKHEKLIYYLITYWCYFFRYDTHRQMKSLSWWEKDVLFDDIHY